MKFKQSDIDRVLDANCIEDVIGEYLHLKKEGSRYKCLCPIHNEKTPSFVVTPSMNIYKCFSCGASGNAITFLTHVQGMSFVEAVKYLAKKANIQLHAEDEPTSPEEEERERKFDLAKRINEEAAKFFKEQLYGDNQKAKFALTYAENRWGKEFVKTSKIGFAPGHNAFLQWAKGKGYSVDFLIEIGLLKKSEEGKIYDAFFDRITMPVCSRSNQILGFTARVLNDSKPKYINSPESFIFHKSKTIFGIEVATRSMAAEGIIYLVEGAPDVYRLHSIGVPNAVASLGTAWSDEQYDFLKKYNAAVCFIPDIDPPKGGVQFGPGIIAVMKNGAKAVKAGLTVLVKEIHPESADEKADADSYIKSKAILESIPNEDFIEWYTRKKGQDKTSAAERANVLSEVSELLAKVANKNYQNILEKKIGKILGIPQSIIQNSVNEKIKENSMSSDKGDSKLMNKEFYSKYGFYEEHNCYNALSDGGKEQQWSNFVMYPLFHIKDALSPKRLFRIVNVRGREEIVEMKQEDLISLNRFRLSLEGLGNFIWKAKEEQLIRLKEYLYENTETATEIKQLGWQNEGFFAFGNGVFYVDKWIEANEFGIIKIPDAGNYYLPATSRIFKNDRKLFQFERRFAHKALSSVSFRAYTDKMIEVFGDNAKVGICFMLATLFKDVVTARTKNFPILNLFGPKGSGKSELGHSLMSFFIIGNEPPNISTSTEAALAEAVAQTANALVHIDEYKNTIELNRREFIKGLYDGIGRTRMNMDRDKKRETTAVDCGVIVSGQEMPTIDIALFQRMIYLTFDKGTHNAEEQRIFDEFKDMRDMGATHLTMRLLRNRKRVEAEFGTNYKDAMDEMHEILGDCKVEDRIFRDWLTPLAMFRTLERNLDVSFTYKEMLEICCEGVKRQDAVSKSTNELASFWQVVDYLHQNGEIFIGADYRICFEKELRCKGMATPIIFKETTQILYLCPKRVMMLYKKNGKTIGESTIPTESLRHYLEISGEYLGIKNAIRFKNVANSEEATAPTVRLDGSKTYEPTTRVDWALCFDYRKLVEHYGINLEVETGQSIEDVETLTGADEDRSMPF